MPRVHHVKSARKPIPSAGINVGDSYYWWKFRFGGKRISKTYPRRSQTTQSNFYSTLYDIEDSIKNPGSLEDIRDLIEDLSGRLNDLRDECQSALDNMPDNLRDSSLSGELLQQRVDDLDGLISELDGIDVPDDPEEDETEEEACERIMEEIAGANWGIG